MYNSLINNEKQTKFPWRSLLQKGVLSGGRIQNLNAEKRAEGDMSMEWNTVYLRGKSNFENEVRHNLEHNGFRFMPGFSYEKDWPSIGSRTNSASANLKKPSVARPCLSTDCDFITVSKSL